MRLNGARPRGYIRGGRVMENTVAITREHVLQALATVPDAGGATLVSSGRLSEIVVDEAGRVMFSIAIEPAEAAAMERVRQAAEAAISGLPGVKGAFVSLTADRPPPRDVAVPDARPPGHAPSPKRAGHPGRHARHRGGVRQGRRRQVDDRLQSRPRASIARLEGRHS